MKVSPAARHWLQGFVLSFAFALVLSGPGKVRYTLLFFPVGFGGFVLALWLAACVRAVRERRRLRRLWRRIEAQALSSVSPRRDRRH